MPGPGIYGAIVLLTVLHAVLLLYAVWSGRQTRERDDGREPEEYLSEEGVECPECGEFNEKGYRYCRQCISELPTPVGFLKGESTPQERRTL